MTPARNQSGGSPVPCGQGRRLQRACHPFGWLLLWPAVGGGLLAAIGYAPTRWLAGSDGVRAMAAALAVVAVVVEVALLGTRRRMAAAKAAQRLRIALGGGLVRFVLTLAAALAVIHWTNLPPAAFLVWVAIAYVVIVLVETGILAAWSKRIESR